MLLHSFEIWFVPYLIIYHSILADHWMLELKQIQNPDF